MTRGIGCDIIEIHRIRSSIEKHGQNFLDRLFTLAEQEYCNKYRDSIPHYAVRFAAKEAIVKALGTGIGDRVSWLDMEVLNQSEGKPEVVFSEHVNNAFDQPQVQISLSHCKEYAVAVASWVN